MSLRRLMFASCHAFVDPLSDSAWAARGILRLLTGMGVDCRALTAGVLHGEREQPLPPLLEALGVPYRVVAAGRGVAGAGAIDVLDLKLDEVFVTMVPTASSRSDMAPDLAESRAFLDLAAEAIRRFRPQVLLVAGGQPADLELMALARRGGVPVAAMPPGFAPDRRAFAESDMVLVPSEYARRYYASRLGLEATAIPPPVDLGRAIPADPDPRYLTFADPRPTKGVTVFARIASELAVCRADIPILVVEGRSGTEALADAGLDLSGLANLHRMAAPVDPREVHRATRALLVPTLIREAFGRSAAEAMAAGIPVLASDRGALPETLGDAGSIFTVHDRHTPAGKTVPSPREVAAWVATAARIWDDPRWEANQRTRAIEASSRFSPDHLAGRYLESFERLARN